MYLKQIVDKIGDMANDDTLKSTGTNSSKTYSWVQECYYLDILPSYDWSFRKKDGQITLTPTYSTGLISISTGSTTVTGSGTTFTSAMVGRKLFIGSEGRGYTIASYSSATSISITEPYEGQTSQTLVSFLIAKTEYNLPRWVDHNLIYEVVAGDTSRKLERISKRQFNWLHPGGNSTGNPSSYSLSNFSRTSYSTGTVTGTTGAKVLTGSSTNWATSGLEQYDLIRIGDYVYTVDSVDSNTQITLFEDLLASPSASSYSAIVDRGTISFYPFPEVTMTVDFVGGQITPPLEDDYDVPILPDSWHWLLVKGGYMRALKHNQDPGVEQELAEFGAALAKFKRIDGTQKDGLERFML